MKKLMIAASLLLILFAFTSCSNGNQSLDDAVATTVAEELDPRTLVEKVLRDGDRDGVDISYDLREAADGAKPTYTHILGVTVAFSGYEYSSVLTIGSGRLAYTFYGTMAGTRFTSGSYELRTEEAMAVSGTSEGTVEVELSVDAREGSSGTRYSVTLGTDEETGETVAAGAPSVSVAIPDDAVLKVGGTETAIPEDEPEHIPPSNPYGFAGGTGTESDPYLIANASQFLQIGSEAFQNVLLEGENGDLYFRLTGDIDLSNHSGYAARVISGTLDGDGHTIRCSNDMPYLFEYFFEDSTFRDFTIEFGDSSVTRLFTYPAIRSAETVKGSPKGSTDTANLYSYDKAAISLIFENVDFRAPDNDIRIIGDNNFAFYISNVGAFDVFLDGKSSVSYSSLPCIYNETGEGEREFLTFDITLTGCDVEGNFYGGFGNSGAAIFLGGQFLGAQIDMDDCHYDGNLEGMNVALVVANHSGCDTYGSSISVSDVNLASGKVFSCTANGSLAYSNTKDEIAGMAGVPGYEGPETVFPVAIEGALENKEISIEMIDSADTYQFKLFLPSMYWYESVSSIDYISQTDSNTFTINIDAAELSENPAATGVFVAKVLSKTEADHLASLEGMDVFGNIPETSWKPAEEGWRYAYVDYNDEKYMVIDYGELIRMYSDSGLSDSVDGYRYLLKLIIIAKDSDGSVIGTSRLTDIPMA